MPEHLSFYLALSLFITHELDAIRCREWRIFPVLSLLNERPARSIFIFAHVPLLLALFYKLGNNPKAGNFIQYMDIFFVAHLIMHIFYLKHKNNEFKDWLSWLAIGGAGLFGFTDLIY